jgi:8-oxo-dGTP pyrophosphatase MutT (NUDIX family)
MARRSRRDQQAPGAPYDQAVPTLRRAVMLLIVTHEQRLLLHHRDETPGIAHPGCWAGFGGAVDEGEPLEHALHREVFEETGLRVADPIFLTEALDEEGDGRLVSLYYTVSNIQPADINLGEGAGIGLHTLQALDTLRVTPFVRRAIHSHLVPVLTQQPADTDD